MDKVKKKKKTWANKLNNYKDLKRENQFKKKESTFSLSQSQTTVHTTVHSKTQRLIEKKRENREAKCKIP